MGVGGGQGRLEIFQKNIYIWGDGHPLVRQKFLIVQDPIHCQVLGVEPQGRRGVRLQLRAHGGLRQQGLRPEHDCRTKDLLLIQYSNLSNPISIAH